MSDGRPFFVPYPMEASGSIDRLYASDNPTVKKERASV
jgi:hypothetical protein